MKRELLRHMICYLNLIYSIIIKLFKNKILFAKMVLLINNLCGNQQ